MLRSWVIDEMTEQAKEERKSQSSAEDRAAKDSRTGAQKNRSREKRRKRTNMTVQDRKDSANQQK